MAATSAQLNTTGSTSAPPPSGPCSWPGAALLIPGCQGQLATGTGTGASNPASFCQLPGVSLLIPGCQGTFSQGTGQQNTTDINTGLVNLIQADLTMAIDAPFKALGLTSLKDAMWRLLLIGIGLLVLAFGLLILAGSAVKEEVSSPGVQQAASTAALAA